MEYQETWADCASRETLEETGLSIKNVRFGTVTNDIFHAEQKHYVTIIMLSDYDSGYLQLMEPDKCEKWEWFTWEDLPDALFVSIESLLEDNYNPLKQI